MYRQFSFIVGSIDPSPEFRLKACLVNIESFAMIQLAISLIMLNIYFNFGDVIIKGSIVQ
jgi:hypothetical protein